MTSPMRRSKSSSARWHSEGALGHDRSDSPRKALGVALRAIRHDRRVQIAIPSTRPSEAQMISHTQIWRSVREMTTARCQTDDGVRRLSGARDIGSR